MMCVDIKKNYKLKAEFNENQTVSTQINRKNQIA